mgnify:CR=1 FL=1
MRRGAKTQLHVPDVCLIGSWMQDAGNSMRLEVVSRTLEIRLQN